MALNGPLFENLVGDLHRLDFTGATAPVLARGLGRARAMRNSAARLRRKGNVFDRRARTAGPELGCREGFKLQNDPALETFPIM